MTPDMKHAFKWEGNPFTFKILPDLFVGHSQEVEQIISNISNGDKFALLLGPTGSGKTTLLKHISNKFPEFEILYLAKPPKDPKDWVTVFNHITKPRLSFLRRHNGVDLYNLSEKVNKKLGVRKCLIFVDECHEATQESLEWLRTITDQVENLTIILAGLPVFENMLKDNLETFLRRITLRIDLGCLSKPETREFIKKRIESLGGDDIRPFTPAIIDYIHEKTGGFPREVLKVCNDLTHKALQRGLTTIDTDFLEEADLPSQVSLESLEALPARQKLIVDTLAKEGSLTPTEIVQKIQAKGEYKNQENAIRAVNNLARRLQSDGFLERKKTGKAFKYKISPRYQTLMVNA